MSEVDEKFVEEIRDKRLDAICKEFQLPKNFFGESTNAVVDEEKQRLFTKYIHNREIRFRMSFEMGMIETFGVLKKYNYMFPKSFSYQEYLKKLTNEELKKHITIYSIINLGNDIPDDLENYDSEVFKEIKIIHCPKAPVGKQLRGFIDDRKFGNEGYEIYKPYLDVIPEEVKENK